MPNFSLAYICWPPRQKAGNTSTHSPKDPRSKTLVVWRHYTLGTTTQPLNMLSLIDANELTSTRLQITRERCHGLHVLIKISFCISILSATFVIKLLFAYCHIWYPIKISIKYNHVWKSKWWWGLWCCILCKILGILIWIEFL